MELALFIFMLTLACLALLLFGLVKPGKVFLGAKSTRGRVGQVYGMGFIVLLIAFVVAVPKTELEQPTAEVVASSESPEKVERAPEATLGISPEEFRQRFNDVIGKVDDSYKSGKFEVSEGSVNDTFNQAFGTNVAMVGTISKQNSELKSLTLIVAGGDGAETVKAIAVLLAAAQSANPELPKEQVANAVMDLTKGAMENIETGDSIKRTLGNVEYSAGASKITGLMLSISPAKQS